MKVSLALALLSMVGPLKAAAQSVKAKDGDIHFLSAAGETRQLTSSGLDSAPALSPDARIVAFIRATPGEP